MHSYLIANMYGRIVPEQTELLWSMFLSKLFNKFDGIIHIISFRSKYVMKLSSFTTDSTHHRYFLTMSRNLEKLDVLIG